MTCTLADYAWLGTPLAAITAAVIAAVFAARQARTARNTLAEKLFDRRFPIYEPTTALLRHITANNMMFNDVVTKYLSEVRTARWLFDAKLAQYLHEEIGGKALDLVTLDAEFQALRPAERKTSLARQREIKEWFESQRPVIDEKFGKFLRLRH